MSLLPFGRKIGLNQPSRSSQSPTRAILGDYEGSAMPYRVKSLRGQIWASEQNRGFLGNKGGRDGRR